MSNPTIRAFPIFYNGRKIAEANDNNANVKPGRTAMFAAEQLAELFIRVTKEPEKPGAS